MSQLPEIGPKKGLRILFLGDAVGKPGCAMLARWTEKLKESYQLDLVIANGENSASSGRGITPSSAALLKKSGVDVITTGNHVWDRKEGFDLVSQDESILRPINFPDGVPGRGSIVFDVMGTPVGIINLMGRAFMREALGCPFAALKRAVARLKVECRVIIVDFHAEATGEKQALGLFVDGMVSALVGTHTHVQTHDHRIFPGGTAFMADVGFAGSENSCLGFEYESVIKRHLLQMPTRFSVDDRPPYVMNGVIIEVDRFTGKSLGITPLRIRETTSILQD